VRILLDEPFVLEDVVPSRGRFLLTERHIFADSSFFDAVAIRPADAGIQVAGDRAAEPPAYFCEQA